MNGRSFDFWSGKRNSIVHAGTRVTFSARQHFFAAPVKAIYTSAQLHFFWKESA